MKKLSVHNGKISFYRTSTLHSYTAQQEDSIKEASQLIKQGAYRKCFMKLESKQQKIMSMPLTNRIRIRILKRLITAGINVLKSDHNRQKTGARIELLMERIGIFLGNYYNCLLRVLQLVRISKIPLDELDNNRRLEDDEIMEEVIVLQKQLKDIKHYFMDLIRLVMKTVNIKSILKTEKIGSLQIYLNLMSNIIHKLTREEIYDKQMVLAIANHYTYVGNLYHKIGSDNLAIHYYEKVLTQCQRAYAFDLTIKSAHRMESMRSTVSNLQRKVVITMMALLMIARIHESQFDLQRISQCYYLISWFKNKFLFRERYPEFQKYCKQECLRVKQHYQQILFEQLDINNFLRKIFPEETQAHLQDAIEDIQLESEHYLDENIYEKWGYDKINNQNYIIYKEHQISPSMQLKPPEKSEKTENMESYLMNGNDTTNLTSICQIRGLNALNEYGKSPVVDETKLQGINRTDLQKAKLQKIQMSLSPRSNQDQLSPKGYLIEQQSLTIDQTPRIVKSDLSILDPDKDKEEPKRVNVFESFIKVPKKNPQLNVDYYVAKQVVKYFEDSQFSSLSQIKLDVSRQLDLSKSIRNDLTTSRRDMAFKNKLTKSMSDKHKFQNKWQLKMDVMKNKDLREDLITAQNLVKEQKKLQKKGEYDSQASQHTNRSIQNKLAAAFQHSLQNQSTFPTTITRAETLKESKSLSDNEGDDELKFKLFRAKSEQEMRLLAEEYQTFGKPKIKVVEKQEEPDYKGHISERIRSTHQELAKTGEQIMSAIDTQKKQIQQSQFEKLQMIMVQSFDSNKSKSSRKS